MITEALYERLAGDATLAELLAEYRGQPAVFTTARRRRGTRSYRIS